MLKPEDVPQDILTHVGQTHSKRINTLIMDIIENSGEADVRFSSEMLGWVEKLREFLYANVYRRANAQIEDSRVDHVLRSLFDHELTRNGDNAQEAVDFISGMTDRFALQLFHEVFVPSPWQWGHPLES